MKILLSNDDGVGAPGLNALRDVLKDRHDVVVVAPKVEKSASGHALTLRKNIPYQKINESEYAVDGFPADCVAMGILGILKNDPPDLVISGINRGGNLGQDSYYSGTVAAAREAIFRGIPALSVSLVVEYPNSDLECDHFITAASFVDKLVSKPHWIEEFDLRCMVNINVPNLPAEKIAGVGIGSMGFRKRRLEMIQADGEYQVIGGDCGFADIPGSDCQIIADNKISVSPLNIFPALTDRVDAWRNILKSL